MHAINCAQIKVRSLHDEPKGCRRVDLRGHIVIISDLESLMDIWETNKILLFIAFVIPGFISLKTYELLLPSVTKESAKQLIDAITYSCVNYALLLWPIYEVEVSQVQLDHPSVYVAFYVLVLLVAPIAWAYLFSELRRTEFFQTAMPHPTLKPWDYVFEKRNEYWIIATLKDGKQIAGLYGSSSFASSAPAPEQLYLEEAWVLNDDGGFDRKRLDTAGIMILSTDLVTIELFNVTHGGNNVR